MCSETKRKSHLMSQERSREVTGFVSMCVCVKRSHEFCKQSVCVCMCRVFVCNECLYLSQVFVSVCMCHGCCLCQSGMYSRAKHKSQSIALYKRETL
ncbi:hypothetical protein BRARA_I03162 [Brassica rapa]|uniref:Uncharacterized protein n=1 Tax=Brassica campestris TaxID=3711 RepID=A0A397Y165_BRACM|nr:hypothetical protein BRARA_I03162 [Brassica rapa]